MYSYDELKRKNEELRKHTKEFYHDIETISNKVQNTVSVISNAEYIIDELDQEFAEKNKLEACDVPFVFLAAALQCARQFILTPFLERVPHNEAEKHVEKEKAFLKGLGDPTNSKKFYYASFGDIAGKPGVPYDITFDITNSNAGLSGKNHRTRTLGHDPILGYVFGTANIVTNTITYNSVKSCEMFSGGILKTKHVRTAPNAGGRVMPAMTQNADTVKMFQAVFKRFQEEPKAIAAALIKQYAHIKSDVYSKAGIPLPIITQMPNVSEYLTKHGIDLANTMTMSSQVIVSEFINFIISFLYGLSLDVRNSELNTEIRKNKTNQIILISNSLASAVNIGYVAITEDVKTIDIGGICNTLHHLVFDMQYRKEIEEKYIINEIYKRMDGGY